MHNLGMHTYPTLLSASYTSATSTDHYYDAQDMRGYEGVYYVAVICTTTATGTGTQEHINAEMSATSSGTGTWVEVADSAAYMTTSWGAMTQTAVIVDVFRPAYRWVRLIVDRDTTARQIDAAFALQYRPLTAPPTISTATGIGDYAIVVGTSGEAS